MMTEFASAGCVAGTATLRAPANTTCGVLAAVGALLLTTPIRRFHRPDRAVPDACTANVDFVIFPDRAGGGKYVPTTVVPSQSDMSEFMGLIHSICGMPAGGFCRAASRCNKSCCPRWTG